jgi:hypothetical protein
MLWRRGEGVEPSGNNISRQAGFEDRWGHRAPSSSRPYLLRGYGDLHNLQIAQSAHLLPTIFGFGFTQRSEHAALAIPPEPFETPDCFATLVVW